MTARSTKPSASAACPGDQHRNLTLPKVTGVVYRLRGQTEVGTDRGATGGDRA